MGVDHKIVPGSRKEWETKAQSYSGQMNCYCQTLIQNGRPCLESWIHFAVVDGALELRKLP